MLGDASSPSPLGTSGKESMVFHSLLIVTTSAKLTASFKTQFEPCAALLCKTELGSQLGMQKWKGTGIWRQPLFILLQHQFGWQQKNQTLLLGCIFPEFLLTGG